MVAPGPHLITARGDNVNAVGRRVQAAPGQTVRLELEVAEARVEIRLARQRDKLVAARDDRGRADAVAAMLGLVGAREAVVVTSDGPSAIAARIYTARGGLGPPRRVDDDLGAILQPLRPLTHTLDTPRGGRRPGRVVPVDRGPWWRQRWAKAALGGAVGVVVVGIVTAIVTRDAGSSTFGGVDVE